ncbi:MAG: TolC family protein [Candidatus Binatia bacterium]|nr:TolC family protein [Candidatus Binatia bacterium]
MRHERQRRARYQRAIGLAACLLSAACNLPFATSKAAYLEPETLAPKDSSEPWQPQAGDLDAERETTRVLAREDRQLSAAESYDLATLVDVAMRTNPRTREAWEAARVRAAAFGGTLGGYLPDIGVQVEGGNARYLFESRESPNIVTQYSITPLVQLEWILFDFGRRPERAESARRQLLAANLNFNRALQEVLFSVQTTYFALDAAGGMLRAAESNFVSAHSVASAAEERLARGLATRSDVLLARQAEAKAAYELESARVLVSDAEANLALAVGVPANQSIHIQPMEDVPLELSGSVDALIDVALAERPDLAARVEELRAQEAIAREAKADLYPVIYAAGNYGLDAWWYQFSGPPTVQSDTPVWNAGLGLRWSIFEGFERLNTIREAEAEASRVRARLERAELETIAAVWRAYHDQRAAVKKYEYAQALLDSSQEAYEGNLESYRHGLATVVDLLKAEGDLAEARYILVQSRADLLTQAARIAYVAGAIPDSESGSDQLRNSP